MLEASNGSEALLFCERYSGPIHALVTDVVMPHMDGYEVAERLRTIRPGMRMLFVSGYTEHVAGRQGRARAPGTPSWPSHSHPTLSLGKSAKFLPTLRPLDGLARIWSAAVRDISA